MSSATVIVSSGTTQQRRDARLRWLLILALALFVAVAAGVGVWAALLHQREAKGAVALPAATLIVSSVPGGALVQVDGHEHGHTPAQITVAPGTHHLTFTGSHAMIATATVHAAGGETVEVSGTLWLQRPAVHQLRPPFPGASITGAGFLADGRVALSITLPPGHEHALWVRGPDGALHDTGPSTPQGPLAISGDGTQVAYLAPATDPPNLSAASNSRWSTVWTMSRSGGTASKRYGLPAGDTDDQLTDLSWAPDGRHLLLVRRQQAAGGTRTHMLWLDVAQGTVQTLVTVLPAPSVEGAAQDGERAPVMERNGATNGHAGHVLREPSVLLAPDPVPIPIPMIETASIPPSPCRARIEIRCFGAMEVCGDGHPLSAQGQYLPWELLIYLALHPAAGVPKRELLRLLWPNTNAKQAGPRLRAAMVRLRDVLGAQLPGLPSDVVRGERDGTCHLDTSLVWSDAQQFLALCQQARRAPADEVTPLLKEARALYRGDLFAEPYFGWMDRRPRGLTLRERFREDYATITYQLAERYEATGQWGSAVSLYTELLRAQPAFQEVARHLYRCYAQLGDHTALVAEHERLVASLEHLRRTTTPGQAPPGGYALERETVVAYEAALAGFECVGAGHATA